MEWWIWIVLGAVLLIADIALINTYYLIWFGAGALLAGLLALVVPESALWLQIAVFGISSLASLLIWLFVFSAKISCAGNGKSKRRSARTKRCGGTL